MNADQFVINEDFIAKDQDQISVSQGDKVELLDRFATPDQEYVAVAVIDEETKKPSTKRGNVPYRILFSLDNV
uniref:SH3 domain-containing protein n=1 Tax=Panagrolaimus sp. PS1159 TaxID=55785 RepID=A0AC35FTH1_9BILA